MSARPDTAGRPALLARLDGQLFAAVPARRLAAVRILVGAYALVHTLVQVPTLWNMAAFAPERFAPVGVLTGLSEPPAAALVRAGLVLLALGAVAFVTGARFRTLGPLFAVCLLVATTFRNSWGHMGHGDNLMVLHVAVLACAPAADTWSFDARRGAVPADDGRYGWPLLWMMWIAGLAYFVAGVAKLHYGGWHWLDGSVLGDQVAGDTLRKLRLGAMLSPFSGAIAAHPGSHAPIALMTLVLELGAPLAVLTVFRGRLRRAWVVGLWSMHAGILAVMSIGFLYPLSGAAYACFFAVDEPMLRALARWRSRKADGARPAEGSADESSAAEGSADESSAAEGSADESSG